MAYQRINPRSASELRPAIPDRNKCRCAFAPPRFFSVWAVLLVALLARPAVAGVDRTIEARWSELIWIEGEKVRVITTDGATARGRVSAVRADDILLKGKNQGISRASVAEIRVIEYRGDSGRRWGKRVGGAVGLLGGLLGAVAVGLDETSQHKSRDKAVATVLAVGGLPIGLTAGYLIGKQADKVVTAIRVIPGATEPPAVESPRDPRLRGSSEASLSDSRSFDESRPQAALLQLDDRLQRIVAEDH